MPDPVVPPRCDALLNGSLNRELPVRGFRAWPSFFTFIARIHGKSCLEKKWNCQHLPLDRRCDRKKERARDSANEVCDGRLQR